MHLNFFKLKLFQVKEKLKPSMIFHSTVITFENISSNVSEQDFQRIVSPVL